MQQQMLQVSDCSDMEGNDVTGLYFIVTNVFGISNKTILYTELGFQ